ncbi:MAG: SIR2 family protein [Actinomycetota bacterium]|nr:SIR2 family protein [Actinomycetota bacterium]
MRDANGRPFGLPEFVRVIERRGPNLGWFLGAGASISAGVPSAEQLILRFQKMIYATEQRVPVEALDLADPAIRHRLRQHFAADSRFPTRGATEEYAAYFEAVYPNAADRRHYIQTWAEESTPSYAHIVLASLMSLGKLNVVWTTNFDAAVEDAAAIVLGRARRLRVAALQEPEVASRVISQGDWPLLVKLHGDYLSERLKNTSDELRAQDRRLRQELQEYLRRAGLIVVGYSGRDNSVMDALTAALEAPQPFQAGLFWVVRRGEQPYERVRELIRTAQQRGVDAHIVEVESFEELMSDVRLTVEVTPDLEQHLNRFQPRRRFSGFSIPPREGGWPILKLNALPVVQYPRTARLVRCKIGNTAEVRSAIEAVGIDAVAIRRSDGVIGFGRDQDFLEAFSPFGDVELDYGTVDPSRSWRQETSDMGLLYDALVRGLARSRPVVAKRRHRQHVLAVGREHDSDPLLADLRRAVKGQLRGTVPDTDSAWAEAVQLRLEHRFGRLWLIYEPIVWSAHHEDDEVDLARKNFVRERQVRRYNQVWNDMLGAWSNILTLGDKESWVTALECSDGVNATFVIQRANALTRSI